MNYREQLGVYALMSVFEEVLRVAKDNPSFNDDENYVDISDGAMYMPMILLDRTDVESLINVLESLDASSWVIEYLKKLKETA